MRALIFFLLGYLAIFVLVLLSKKFKAIPLSKKINNQIWTFTSIGTLQQKEIEGGTERFLFGFRNYDGKEIYSWDTGYIGDLDERFYIPSIDSLVEYLEKVEEIYTIKEEINCSSYLIEKQCEDNRQNEKY